MAVGRGFGIPELAGDAAVRIEVSALASPDALFSPVPRCPSCTPKRYYITH